MRRCKFGRRADGKCRKTPRSHSFRGLGNAELRAAARAIDTGRRPAARKAAKVPKVKKPSKRKPASGRGQFCVMERKSANNKMGSRCFTSADAARDYAVSTAGNRAIMLYKRKKR